MENQTAQPQSIPSNGRQLVDPIVVEHGTDARRYCWAMLGAEGGGQVFVGSVGYLEDHPISPESDTSARLVLLAMVHNRCLEYCRTQGIRSRIPADSNETDAVTKALARLRPIGRDALVLRLVLRLRWEEIEQVCGIPRRRAMVRVCRAWRRLVRVVEGSVGSGRAHRASGLPLTDHPEAWAAVREDARRFSELRTELRRICALENPPLPSTAEVWAQVDRLRILEEQRRQEYEAERRRRNASRIPTVRDRPVRVPNPKPEPHQSPANSVAPSGRRLWLWLVALVVLGLLGLIVRQYG